MKSKIFLLCALLAGVTGSSCSNLETVEIKNPDGQVVERYERNPETLAKHGEYRRFDEDNILMEIAHYEDDVLDGERRVFYEDGTTVQAIEQYEQGDFVGTYQTFYPSGNLKLEGNYTDNEMNGIWKKYYDSGELAEEVRMENSLEQGAFKEYYRNGNLKAEGTYRDGDNEHGELKLYNEDGSLDRIMDCDMGRCVSRGSVNENSDE